MCGLPIESVTVTRMPLGRVSLVAVYVAAVWSGLVIRLLPAQAPLPEVLLHVLAWPVLVVLVVRLSLVYVPEPVNGPN